jgi:SAM-dependent methyltransferase
VAIPISGSIAWSPEERVIWHDLECGGYGIDLPLWLELAAAAPGAPVLDAGCGTGRVALPLARAGNPVTAVDVDVALVGELARRAATLPVEIVCADACELELPSRGFALCVAALQTIQLFGGQRPRARFLAAARRHLRPGGILACAIVSELESYGLADGNEAPPADHVRRNGRLYVSHATAMRVQAHTIELKRWRLVIGEGGRRDLPEPKAVEVLQLARFTATQLESEGRAVGLTPLARRAIPAGDGYLGSEVVLLRA